MLQELLPLGTKRGHHETPQLNKLVYRFRQVPGTGCKVTIIIVVGDHAANRDTAIGSNMRQCSFELGASDILKVDIDPFRCTFSEFG